MNLLLQVLLRCGQLAVYQAILTTKPEWPNNSRNSLGVQFTKVMTRTFEPRNDDGRERMSALAEQRRAFRSLVPFTTPTGPESSMAGIFVTGDQPTWIFGTDKEGIVAHTSAW